MRFAHILTLLQGVQAEKNGVWLKRGRETRILKEMARGDLRTVYMTIQVF